MNIPCNGFLRYKKMNMSCKNSGIKKKNEYSMKDKVQLKK